MKPDTGRTFCLEEEVKSIRDHMMTFEEFKNLLRKCMYDEFYGETRADVDKYLDEEGFKMSDVRERYDVGVECYKYRKAKGYSDCNTAFYSELERLDNLLSLCWS